MNKATFQVHCYLWGREDADKRFTAEPIWLTDNEHALRDNVLGERLCREHEPIAYGWLITAIQHR